MLRFILHLIFLQMCRNRLTVSTTHIWKATRRDLNQQQEGSEPTFTLGDQPQPPAPSQEKERHSSWGPSDPGGLHEGRRPGPHIQLGRVPARGGKAGLRPGAGQEGGGPERRGRPPSPRPEASAAAHVASGGEDAVGQVVDGEVRILGHRDEGHAGEHGTGRQCARGLRDRTRRDWQAGPRPLRTPPPQTPPPPARADPVTHQGPARPFRGLRPFPIPSHKRRPSRSPAHQGPPFSTPPTRDVPHGAPPTKGTAPSRAPPTRRTPLPGPPPTTRPPLLRPRLSWSPAPPQGLFLSKFQPLNIHPVPPTTALPLRSPASSLRALRPRSSCRGQGPCSYREQHPSWHLRICPG